MSAVRSLSLLVSSIQQKHTMHTRCMLPCVTHVCAHAFRHAWLRYAQMFEVGGLLQNRHCITCVHRADAQVDVLRELRHAHGPDRFMLDGYRLVASEEHASASQMEPIATTSVAATAVNIDGCLATLVGIGIDLEVGR